MKEEYAGIIDIVISMDCAALLFEMEYVLMEVWYKIQNLKNIFFGSAITLLNIHQIKQVQRFLNAHKILFLASTEIIF